MLKKKLGSEAIERFWINDSLKKYYRIPSTLIVPKGCIRIEARAFEYGYRLRKVIISESVKVIGMSAFDGCINLEKVVIPGSVKEIRTAAFCNCREATIILGKPEWKFKDIGKFAFDGCKDVRVEDLKKGWRERLALFWNKVKRYLKTSHTFTIPGVCGCKHCKHFRDVKEEVGN